MLPVPPHYDALLRSFALVLTIVALVLGLTMVLPASAALGLLRFVCLAALIIGGFLFARLLQAVRYQRDTADTLLFPPSFLAQARAAYAAIPHVRDSDGDLRPALPRTPEEAQQRVTAAVEGWYAAIAEHNRLAGLPLAATRRPDQRPYSRRQYEFWRGYCLASRRAWEREWACLAQAGYGDELATAARAHVRQQAGPAGPETIRLAGSPLAIEGQPLPEPLGAIVAVLAAPDVGDQEKVLREDVARLMHEPKAQPEAPWSALGDLLLRLDLP